RPARHGSAPAPGGRTSSRRHRDGVRPGPGGPSLRRRALPPGRGAPELLRRWAAWAPGLPEDASTSVALIRMPPVPELPPPLQGRTVVHLRFAHQGTAEEGQILLA